MSSSRRERSLFLLNFLKNPLRNASIIPSSATASRTMIRGVDFDKVHTILELGPGPGTFTEVLLAHCRPGTRLILIEIEDSYVTLLRQKFGDRVTVVHTSAHLMGEVLAEQGIHHADLIISGLPFLPGEIKTITFDAIRRQTDMGAIFRYFTYMPAIMRRVYRGLPVEEKFFVWQNIPPMWIYGIN
ncbi:MAG: rRNA adenine N-6-methyltransferase family protein [Bacteroidia bacterium]|nr:rRNA adenine N-6-methyltransferase family protein [Bacteroidia bacterium]